MLPWALSLSGGYKNPAGGCRTCHLPGHQCLTPGKHWSLGQLPCAHGWGLGASSCGNRWRSIQDLGLDLSSAPGAVVGAGDWGIGGCPCLWQWQGVDAQRGHAAASAAQHCPACTGCQLRGFGSGSCQGEEEFPWARAGMSARARCPLGQVPAAPHGPGGSSGRAGRATELFICSSMEQPSCCPPHCC